jgi:recombination protein RecR
MDSIHTLTELFKEFPGIGPRQAKRFVYFLLTKNTSYATELSRRIIELKNYINTCESCFRFFAKDHSPLCATCRNGSREKQSLMLVCHDVDFENIEKTKAFNGYYFILGGTVPVLEKNPETKIRQRELIACIQKKIKEDLTEIIIAFDYNPEGEHTREYIERLIRDHTKEKEIKITHLGRGLSTGSELEYTDGDTIKNALRSRL